MKKIFNFSTCFLLVMGMLIISSLCSCGGDDDKDDGQKYNEELLYVRPWKEYPQSYIKLFDYRFQFNLLNIQRNGSSLQIEYTLINRSFNQEVRLSFAVNGQTTARDDLGNTYNYFGYTYIGGLGEVRATIDGKQLDTAGTVISFMPNQVTRGTITISDFDINATQVSFSTSVSLVSPKNVSLAYNRIDFVNIPIESGDYEEM